MIKASLNSHQKQDYFKKDYQQAQKSSNSFQCKYRSVPKYEVTPLINFTKTQIQTKHRYLRKPIFSLNQNGSSSINSLIQTHENKMCPSTKLISNVAQNYISNTKEYESHSQYKFQNYQLLQQHFNKTILKMQNWFDQKFKILQKNNYEQFKKNQQSLLMISTRLHQTQSLLLEKALQLQKLKNSLFFCPQCNTQNQKMQMKEELTFDTIQSSCLQYICGRMRDIDTKINIVLQKQCNIIQQRQKQQIYSSKIQKQVSRLGFCLTKVETTKIKAIVHKLNKFVQYKGEELQNLKFLLHQVETQRQKQFQFIKQNYNQHQQRITYLKKELKSISNKVQAYSLKQFKYDNFVIEQLQLNINKIMLGLNQRENDFILLNNQIDQLSGLEQKKEKILPNKFQLKTFPNDIPNQMARVQDQIFSKSETSSSNQAELSGGYRLYSECFENQKDVCFNQKHNSSYQRFTDQEQQMNEQPQMDGQQQYSQIVVQLKQVIKKARIKMPAQCILNNCYIKLAHNKGYVMDSKGSLLQFSNDDIQIALNKNLITFSSIKTS